MFFFKKIVYFFLWLAGNLLFRILFRIEIEGEENIKDLKGPVVVVFNHSSWIDFLALIPFSPTSDLTPVHFAIWYKYYLAFFPFLVFTGAFPIRKGIGLENTLKKAIKILEKGGVVGIFPEGKRRHFGRRRRARRGAAFLALKCNCPILPIYLGGTLGIKASDLIFRRRLIKIIIGKPFLLPPQEIKDPSDLNAPSAFVLEKIYELSESKPKK